MSQDMRVTCSGNLLGTTMPKSMTMLSRKPLL